MAKPGPSSRLCFTSRMKAREASSAKSSGRSSRSGRGSRSSAATIRVELLLDRGRKRDASGVGGQIIAAPQQALGQRGGEIGDVEHAPTIPAPAQSRRSSLIEVFERVRSSTVFTITAQ